jgi:hypothetical protein
MRRIGWLLLALGVAGAGCLGLDPRADDPRNRAKVEEAPPPPPPVRADDVTAQNAWESAQALGEELRAEERPGPLRMEGVEPPGPRKDGGKLPAPPAPPGAAESGPAR